MRVIGTESMSTQITQGIQQGSFSGSVGLCGVPIG